MKKNILLTGSHRSGSTWAGEVIAKASNVRYTHEPFNIEINTVRYRSPLTYWFEFLIDSPVKHQKDTKKFIESFYQVLHLNNIRRFFKVRSLRDVYNYVIDLKDRITDRTIIKDPIAIMSAEWFYLNFDIDIVVLIRHPAAFIASLKVKDWQHDFSHFSNQPNLMNTYLKEYQDLINDYSKNKKDIIDQGILLWNSIHDVIAYYQDKYKDEWHFAKHEDLSTAPLSEFKEMFSKLNLTLDKGVEDYIKESTDGSKKSNFKRNSAENVKTWKDRLTDVEIERIKKGTENVWKNFYTESDW